MSSPLQAYCLGCKEKRDLLTPTPVFSARGTPGTRGTCAVCGRTLYVAGETLAHAGLPRPQVTAAPKASKLRGKASAKAAKPSVKANGKRASAASARKTKAPATAKKTARGKSVGKLVIVESPAKARSVGRYLGNDYTVKASKGHVRDLLVSRISVDVDNDFEPTYRVPNDKRAVVKELAADVARADEIFLATDPDREGEAIAWHLIAAARMEDKPVKRVVFHEITKPAVEHAFEQPRDINMDLVNAQQARRILDRLVGYNISELLWDKVRNQLSAGRVQSIAVRMIVDREREVEAFVSEEYWTVEVELRPEAGVPKAKPERAFLARLAKINGEDFALRSEDEVRPHLAVLERSRYRVAEVKRGTRQRRPSAPFTTSTLQQEASRRLGYNTSRTMMLAQQLYEGVEVPGEGYVGLITYMRTDSTNVSTAAQAEARDFVTATYGADFLPERPPVYKTKAKGAQEAHEAIRPTSVPRTPDALKATLGRLKDGRSLLKLYTLIWQRFVASQMANAMYDTLRVDIMAGPVDVPAPYLFRVSGSTVKFPGFLALYEETRDEDLAADEDEGRILPQLTAEQRLGLLRLLPEQHFTQPPPRFTEATLVRALEENGIGRPSTYAPIIKQIQHRGYVQRQDKRLVPSDTGKTVTDLLVGYFPDVMDYQFTARMEDDLDDIAEGELAWRPMLGRFYGPFSQRLSSARELMPTLKQEELVGRTCPKCHTGDLVIRFGRFGKFIGCSRYPECDHTEQLLERTGALCPVCGGEHGGEVVVKKSKRGRTFYGCSRYPACEYVSWNPPKLPDAEPVEADGRTS